MGNITVSSLSKVLDLLNILIIARRSRSGPSTIVNELFPQDVSSLRPHLAPQANHEPSLSVSGIRQTSPKVH
jgi:hypothetical protein